MPVIVRHADAATTTPAPGCNARALLGPVNTGNDWIGLDEVELAAGAALPIALDGGAVGWLLVLDGAGTLGETALDERAMTALPPAFDGGFTATVASRILVSIVPGAARFDAAFAASPPALQTFDWTREPVLNSEHDARQRIYLATAGLFGTDAFKGEMIIYPPGTAAPDHHHEGAEHFQYVVAGTGTARLDGVAHQLGPGDVLYNYEHEVHSFVNDSAEDFVFVEFFVPGPCKTVWPPGVGICAWLPTGADIEGRPPVRDLAYHVTGDDDEI